MSISSKRRVISIVAMLLFSVILILDPVKVSALETGNGSCGENTTWSFDANTGILTISGNGAMSDYKNENMGGKGGNPFFNGTNIKSIIVKEGVTHIGNYAFQWNREYLESVVLPEGLTSIGQNAFEACEALSSVTFPTTLTTIGEYAFNECRSLSNLVLPKGLTTIGRSAFSGCSNVTLLSIPNTVTNIEDGAFAECAMSGIVIPQGTKYIGSGAFWGCANLTSAYIPGSVTIIGEDAFYECDKLSTVVISDGVTQIGDQAFRYCNIKSITIPESVKAIGASAFEGCGNPTILKGKKGSYAETYAASNPYCVFEDIDGNAVKQNPTTITEESKKEETKTEETKTEPDVKQPITAPQKAAVKSIKNNKKKVLTLKWKKVSDSDGYEVQYALNKKFTKSKKTKDIKKTALDIKKLKKGKTYYVRIRAYKMDGSNKVYGKWSAVKSIKIKK